MNEQPSKQRRQKFSDRMLAAARKRYPDPRTCTTGCGTTGSIDDQFGWRLAMTKRRLIPEPQCFKCRREASKRAREAKLRYPAELFDEGFRVEIEREVAIRAPNLVRLAREHHGTVCSVCKFDFGTAYGEHGRGFIEIHHKIPLAEGERESGINDVAPVCSNCHRMLHRMDRVLSIEDLEAIVEEARSKGGRAR